MRGREGARWRAESGGSCGLEVDGWWFLLAEMREHPGGTALYLATFASVPTRELCASPSPAATTSEFRTWAGDEI